MDGLIRDCKIKLTETYLDTDGIAHEAITFVYGYYLGSVIRKTTDGDECMDAIVELTTGEVKEYPISQMVFTSGYYDPIESKRANTNLN